MFWGNFSNAQSSDDRLKRHPGAIEMSKSEMFLASCSNILRNAYGFFRSTEQGVAVDEQGNYLPLYTYPAIEYLIQFDFRNKRIFEYGAGMSTLFWMERAEIVVSAENNAEWYNSLIPKLNNKVKLILAQGDMFPFVLEQQQGEFDLIVIDGAGYRFDSAAVALTKLARGGAIVLDNADWHPNTARLLREGGLIQVDMSGFKPCECHTSTTSIFLHRDFNFPTLDSRQPAYAKGAKLIHSEDWDKPYAKRG